jgi:hypothetical protein
VTCDGGSVNPIVDHLLSVIAPTNADWLQRVHAADDLDAFEVG